MRRSLIGELPSSVGRDVKVQGWVEAIRNQKRMQFLVLRDHTGLAQAVLERSLNQALAHTISNLTPESTVTVIGRVIQNPAVKLGGMEIQISDVRVENLASTPLPFEIRGGTRPNLDTRLNWRFLDLRRPENYLIFELQTTIEAAMREYCINEGFVEIHSPKFMASASESGGELFRVEYFETTAYLAQSPQFYKQMAMAAGFDKVLEIGPVFRANPSFTSRHDTEFTSIDVEISWIDSHEDIMCFEERWLEHALRVVQEEHGKAIFELFGAEVRVPALPFPRMSMREALETLAGQGYTPVPESAGDLDREGERLLTEYVMGQSGHDFLFLTDWPAAVRPFYHMRHEHEPSLTKSFDLFWKGLEITTGAQREHRYDVLANQASAKGLGLDPIQFYLDFFRYGCPPHGGFGLGLTRILMVLLGVPNVREVTYIYRGPNRLSP